MRLIMAEQYNITPGKDVTSELIKLFNDIKGMAGPKTVVFEPGIYNISSKLAAKNKMYITNSMAKKEWERGDVPHLLASALYLEGIDGLVIKGKGALFMNEGHLINLALINCRNITIDGIIFDSVNPDMHVFKAVGAEKSYIDYELDQISEFIEENGKFYFTGPDYKRAFKHRSMIAWWIGLVRIGSPDAIERSRHPFRGAIRLKKIGERIFRAYYLIKPNHAVGDIFHVYDVFRKEAGIFIDRSENITLKSMEQRFNYGLSFVAQDSKDVTVENARFAPEENRGRLMASVADFMQICMCRGKVTVKDSFFKGAGDDALNAHGVHFKVKAVDGNTIFVSFMHGQTFGYNPLRTGDRITYADPKTLLCYGEAKILKSEAIDNYRISLTLDNAAGAKIGDVIEDIDACPDLEYSGNTLDRIITRGLLISTRGKVRITNNRFLHNTMNNILIADDARSWYESGPVRDVEISGNYFIACPDNTVMIKPENSIHMGAVHSNIVIKDNTIETPRFYVKSAEKVEISGNVFKNPPEYKIIDSEVKIQKD